MKACTQCGRCCTNESFMMRLGASDADVARWNREGRRDILAWVSRGDVWIDPVSGETAATCPFVRKVPGSDRLACGIYDTRPETCREYPSHVAHMEFVACEMLDAGDTDDDVTRFMATSA